MSGIDIDVLLTNMMAIIGSYETFVIRTKYPALLCIDLSQSDPKNGFYTKLAGVTVSANLPQLFQALDNVTAKYGSMVSNNMNLTSFAKAAIYPYIFTQPPGGSQIAVIPAFISNFITNPLPPASSYSGIDQTQLEYKASIYSVFQHCYLVLVKFMQSQSDSTIGKDFQTTINDSVSTLYVQSIVTYIENNIYSYMNSPVSSSQDINAFIANVYDGIQTFAGNTSNSMTQSHYNLFFLCFLPYFSFLYIYNVLPTTTLTSGNNGSRNGLVRRFAILALYKVFMYSIYGTYKMSVLFDPSSQSTMQLRQILDTNISALFDQETNKIMTSTILQTLNQNTKTNMNQMSSLQQQNGKVTMNRSNLNNILIYQDRATQDLAKAKQTKWLWFAFLIVYVAIIPIFMFVTALQEHVDYFFIVSVVIMFALIILVMIAMAKNFS